MEVKNGGVQYGEPRLSPSTTTTRVDLLTMVTDDKVGFGKLMFRGLDMSAPALPVAINVRCSVYRYGFTLRVTAVLFNHVTVGVNTPANAENNAEVSTPPPK